VRQHIYLVGLNYCCTSSELIFWSFVIAWRNHLWYVMIELQSRTLNYRAELVNWYPIRENNFSERVTIFSLDILSVEYSMWALYFAVGPCVKKCLNIIMFTLPIALVNGWWFRDLMRRESLDFSCAFFVWVWYRIFTAGLFLSLELFLHCACVTFKLFSLCQDRV
jgi:hypothetical protein